MRASKVISRDEARAQYDAGGVRSWRTDSMVGICMAVQAEVETQLARALWIEQRRHDGLRSVANKPLPQWVADALPDYLLAAKEARLPAGLLGMMTNPAFFEIIEQLCETGGVRWIRGYSDAQRAELAKHVQGVVASRKPAQDRALQAFFLGTRATFHLNRRGEPKASDMRWLAAARGLEPIDNGLDRARKRWGSVATTGWFRRSESDPFAGHD